MPNFTNKKAILVPVVFLSLIFHHHVALADFQFSVFVQKGKVAVRSFTGGEIHLRNLAAKEACGYACDNQKECRYSYYVHGWPDDPSACSVSRKHGQYVLECSPVEWECICGCITAEEADLETQELQF
ncbi:MAG: hypothetical protein KDD70_03460 [Bdellovibrionales bacterium]|nr:hypothetical protein [Bdellovibrionales bacterium]